MEVDRSILAHLFIVVIVFNYASVITARKLCHADDDNWSLLHVMHMYLTGYAHSRSRRDIFQFGHMVEKATGWDKSQFNGYGQYCGLGGSGKPVDRLDKCCLLHDNCYAWTTGTKCIRNLLPNWFLVKYNWKKQNGRIVCLDAVGSCPRALCACDRTAAHCFAHNKEFYNRKFKRHPFKKILTG